MTNRTVGRKAPKGEDWVPKKIRELEQAIAELRAARTLESASIGAGGLISANFDGTLDPAAAGTSGWGLSGTSGDAIFNNLVLRGGIIGDDALTNPVMPAAMSDNANNFPLSNSVITAPATLAIPVPAGFTTALVIATSDLTVTSTVASTASVRTSINGNFTPFGQSVAAPANEQMFVSNTFAQVLTSLGSSIAVQAQVAAAGANIPAGGGTWVNLNALALFIR